MAELVKYPSPILRTVCEPVTEFGEPLREVLAQCAEVLAQEPTGVGIAANQCGFTQRFFLAKFAKQGYSFYINPEIVEAVGTQVQEDGCLSIPGFYYQTERAKVIKLRWQDTEGEFHEASFEDWEAFVVQHEVDHLDGILFVDKLNRPQRRRFEKKYGKDPYRGQK